MLTKESFLNSFYLQLILGMTPFHLAAALGDVKAANMMFMGRRVVKSIDVKDDVGWTPLCLAARHGRIGMVKYLLQQGANPRMESKVGVVSSIVFR